MAESSILNNPDTDPNMSCRKRRRITNPTPPRTPGELERVQWRTESDQQIYSTKLIHALRHIRRPESAAASVRSVRDAADRVLAISAKGKTRWSRAILTGRLSLQLAQINKKYKRAAKPGSMYTRFEKSAFRRKVHPVQRKVEVLSRLVPGCRKISFPNLLGETTDYIAALEMQVKALTFITGLLNGGVSGGGGGEQRISLS